MPCRNSTSGPSPATVAAIRGAGPTNTVSSLLLRFRPGDLHGPRAALAVLFKVNEKVLRRAGDHLVALVDELRLPELGLIENLFRVLIDSVRGFAGRTCRKEKAKPGMRLHFRVAELAER